MSDFDLVKFGPHLRKRAGIYLKCETCSREFYVNQSRIKQVQRNGNKIRFCSQSCYVKTGASNPFWGKKHSADSIATMIANPNRPSFSSGRDNPNFSRFGIDYEYRSPPRRHRSTWRTLFKRCEKCGYNNILELLQVHHKDRNRKNNAEENLIVLCPNCHHEDHFNAKDGFYAKRRKHPRPSNTDASQKPPS